MGITRKTGYRWRAENGGLPPARLAEAARSGRFLSLLERQRIATLRERGHSRDPELRQLVQAKPELEWSPAQITAHLRASHPQRPEWHLCHETISQVLYHGGKGGLSRTLTKKLRTGRPLRTSRLKAGTSSTWLRAQWPLRVAYARGSTNEEVT